MRRSSRELVPRSEKASVLTIKPGRRVLQRMMLPDGTVGLELLTGTFDREGVVVHYRLDRESPDHSACGQGDVAIGNNVYTPLLPTKTEPLPAGTYMLTLENQGDLDVAIYYDAATKDSSNRRLQPAQSQSVTGAPKTAAPRGLKPAALQSQHDPALSYSANEARQSDGWELINDDGARLNGGLTVRALVEDERWNRAFEFVACSGKFWLWNRKKAWIGAQPVQNPTTQGLR